VSSAGEEHVVTTARVVNAAGLGQDRVSGLAGIDVDATGYRTFPCKGCWWAIAPRHRGRVSALVYPVGRAEDPGLGVHLCLDVGGGMRLGPDFVFVEDASDLSVPRERERLFLDAGQRLFPWLEEGDIAPDMAGIRSKLVPRARMWRDFVIAEESPRGLPGWVTLAGIESPGLTAAEAIAERVDALLA
jgi:L-2-hydroxyglutarate oxidase LhgO